MIFNVGVTDLVLFSSRLIDRAINRYIIESTSVLKCHMTRVLDTSIHRS